MIQDKLKLLSEMTQALKEARKMTYQQELEEVLNTFRAENDELKKENEDLRKILNAYRIENNDLKSQIKNMKCCENCKYWIDNDCSIEHDYDCKRWNNHNTDDFWEMKE